MSADIYRYIFSSEIALDDIEGSLVLAIMAAECLHGESRVRLDAGHFFDADRRACVIDAGSAVGRDFNLLFVGFIRREFGADAFRVERVNEPTHQPQERAA